MLELFFDEAGAKTINDKENKFGVITGYIVESEIQKTLLEKEVKKIIKDYQLENLSKLHMSEINDKEIKENIETRIFRLMNNLKIKWIYACSDIESYLDKLTETRESVKISVQSQGYEINALPNIKDVENRKGHQNYVHVPTVNFFEELLLKIFGQVDLINFKNEKIKLLSDNFDKNIKISIDKWIESNIKPKITKSKKSFNRETKKLERKEIIIETDKQPLKFFDYELENSNNDNLTFIADVLTYRIFKIIKEYFIYNNSKEKLYEEILKKHPCKNLISPSNVDRYFDDPEQDWSYLKISLKI